MQKRQARLVMALLLGGAACLGMALGGLMAVTFFGHLPPPNVVLLEGTPSLLAPPAKTEEGGRTGAAGPTPVVNLKPTSTPTALVSTPTPAPTPSPTSTPTPAVAPEAYKALATMSLSTKVGQLLMVGVGSPVLTPALCQAIRNLRPGGIVYTGVDVRNPEQLRRLSESLQECAAQVGLPPLLIAMDHEGQYVNRFKAGATIFPSAMALGALHDQQAIYQAALASGKELRYSGVNVVLGPVADVLLNWDNDVISTRSFGGIPQQVAADVQAAVEGYTQAGLIATLKHFPGHGGVAGDSHTALPVDQASREQLLQMYLPPFEAGIEAGAPMVMSSHVAFPAIDPAGWPASLSMPLMALLRQDMGFHGVVITDSLGMQGARKAAGGISEAAVRAIAAGADMVLIPSSASSQLPWSVRRALEEAVLQGKIPQARLDEAVLRVLTLKQRWAVGYLPQQPPPWKEDEALAYQLAYRSVTLVRNRASWVPLPAGVRRVVVVGPYDGWGLYPVLQAALSQRGIQADVYSYSGPWNGKAIPERGYLSQIPAALQREYDAAIVLTWDAHLSLVKRGDDFQVTLVKRCLAVGKPVVIVALKSPVDIVDFPEAPAYLATYGTLLGQNQGMADALVGKTQPQGIWPLKALP